MWKIKKEIGLHKIVIVFQLFVIKIPKNYKCIIDVLSEQYNYFRCPKNYRHLLLKYYFIPLVPIMFQKKVEICNNNDIEKINCIYNKDMIKYKCFKDKKPNNFGKINNKIIKIDYDWR